MASKVTNLHAPCLHPIETEPVDPLHCADQTRSCKDELSVSFFSPRCVTNLRLEESPTLCSTVSMSDNGAEVTLNDDEEDNRDDNRDDNADGTFETPSKADKLSLGWPLDSLFDAEATPQSLQAPDTPLHSAFCGIAVWCQNDSTSISEHVQGQICSLLESPVPVEHWWCEWTKQRSMIKHEEQHMGKIRNRSRVNPNQCQHHVQSIKENLDPFTSTNKLLKQEIAIHKTKSLDITQRGRDAKNVNMYRKAPGVWEYDWGCSITTPDDTASQEDDVICYDSDPEDFLRKPSRHRLVHSIDDKENMRSFSFTSPISLHPLQLMSDKERVQLFMNKKHTLVFHNYPRRSVAVNAWMERGQQLVDQIISPRLCWQARQQNSRLKVVRQREEVMGFDLLDVQRVVPVTEIDRKKYPFARLRRMFLIQTIDDDYLFEASSNLLRDDFITSLKLTVARFGSKIIVGEYFDSEFFLGIPMGPGQEPTLTYLPVHN
jgi:hypothetical protein